MKLLRSSHSRPSWALTIVILAISLCRESLSMEDAIAPLGKSASSDGGLARDIAEVSGKSVSEDKPSGPKRLDLQEKESKPVPMDIDVTSKKEEQKIFDSQLHQTVMDQLKNTNAAQATNAVQLKIWHGEREAQRLIDQTLRDTAKLRAMADEFAKMVNEKNHVAIIDNEADDLFMLLILAYHKKLPKHIITFGGHVYLRHALVVAYVQALAKFFKLEGDEVPLVHMGIPYISTSARAKPPRYDDEFEGKNYIDPEERKKLIAQSLELEKEAKATDKPWLLEAFKPGMDVMRNMLDDVNSEGTAFTVSTAPSQLVHVFNEKAGRAEKAWVAHTSPFMWDQLEDGRVIWKPTYNSAASSTLPLMNELMLSGAKYMGLGGGVSRSSGFRHLTDAQHGSSGSGVFEDVGVLGLETVVNKDSPEEVFRMLYWATDNITRYKVEDWSQDLVVYDAYMGMNEEERAKFVKTNRPPKMLRWRQHQLVETRRVCKHFGRDVMITTAPADLYAMALLPEVKPLAVQGGIGFGFSPASKPATLVEFHPTSDAHNFAATDVNILAVRDVLQKIVKEGGIAAGTYDGETEARLLKAMAEAKAKAQDEAAADEATKLQAQNPNAQ